MELKKDFYSFLPKYLQDALTKAIDIHKGKEWFEDAWNEYRQHVLHAERRHLQSPNLFFSNWEKLHVLEEDVKKYVAVETEDDEELIFPEWTEEDEIAANLTELETLYCDNDILATEAAFNAIKAENESKDEVEETLEEHKDVF